MPCHAAIAPKFLKLKTDQSVEKAIKAMKKAGVDMAPVVDKDGIFRGLFSFRILMKNLLPVSVVMNDGTQLDVKISAAPGIAKRLKNVLTLPIETFIEQKNTAVVTAEAPIWEGVNILVNTNLPIAVIEADTRQYIGFITQESLLSELERLQKSEA